MADVVVYTTSPCSWCARVKMLLRSKGIEFREVNLVHDPLGFQELAERTGMMSLPQVVVDDELIGGYKETVAADESGRLGELAA
ncbi:MAG: glutaredoxin 3 [Solirubrobacteraceae bacterium]|jgi:glutaredoxin 3|nr:glutaredoxin 3 [Solirubrobacteraceae bacterium]